jgi:hypothetical protein
MQTAANLLCGTKLFRHCLAPGNKIKDYKMFLTQQAFMRNILFCCFFNKAIQFFVSIMRNSASANNIDSIVHSLK